jgi:hypothetical protein
MYLCVWLSVCVWQCPSVCRNACSKEHSKCGPMCTTHARNVHGHIHIYTYTHIYIHSICSGTVNRQPQKHTHIHTHVRSVCSGTDDSAAAETYIHVYIDARAHIHTHTHTYAVSAVVQTIWQPQNQSEAARRHPVRRSSVRYR